MKKINYCKYINILILFICASVNAENFSTGWASAGSDVNKTYFLYHAPTLIKQGTPPQIVSVKIRTSKNGTLSNTYDEFEFHCATDELKVNQGSLQKIPFNSNANTMRDMWYAGFCGINGNGSTFYFIGTQVNTTNNINTHYFIDSLSIKKTASPLPEGIYFRLYPGTIDPTSKKILKLGSDAEMMEAISSCKDPLKIFFKINSKSNFNEVSINDGSIGFSANNLLCRGYFPISQATKVQEGLDFDEGIKKATNQCKDLGFSEGTEKFGDCVLKLSR